MGQSATKCAPPCLPSARFHIDHRKRLGKGTFGTAVLARDSFREKSVAAKIVKLTHSVSEKQLRREMVIQQHAACEHVAAVYGSASRWDQFVIFLELCSGGELCSLVATRGALPEAEVHGYFKQIIAGVVHMHSVGIVHRDLKLENVMLTDKGHVRIIDFGLAHQYSMGDDGTYKERPLSRCCGSEVYSAPEVLDPDVGYSYKADLWSCGVILFALLYGCFPLELASLSDWRFRKLIAAEKAGRGASFAVLRWIERPQHLSHKVCVLIDGLLRVQQAQRLSAVEASANEWVDMPSLSANLSYDSLCEISDEETRRNTARNAARDGPTAGGAPNTAFGQGGGDRRARVVAAREQGRRGGRQRQRRRWRFQQVPLHRQPEPQRQAGGVAAALGGGALEARAPALHRRAALWQRGAAREDARALRELRLASTRAAAQASQRQAKMEAPQAALYCPYPPRHGRLRARRIDKSGSPHSDATSPPLSSFPPPPVLRRPTCLSALDSAVRLQRHLYTTTTDQHRSYMPPSFVCMLFISIVQLLPISLRWSAPCVVDPPRVVYRIVPVRSMCVYLCSEQTLN